MHTPFSKQPTEIIPVTMDFVHLINSTETLTGLTVIATNAINIVATSNIVDASGLSGTVAKAIIKNGIHGERYKITFRATTSEGNLYEEDVYMDVIEQ